MPYVMWARCHLRTYSAALWWDTAVCPCCGTELPRPRATVIDLAEHPRFARRHGTAVERPDREEQQP